VFPLQGLFLLLGVSLLKTPQFDGLDVHFYHWTGANRFFMNGKKDSISMGGGEYVCMSCGR
jgi:hypothetical protein